MSDNPGSVEESDEQIAELVEELQAEDKWVWEIIEELDDEPED